MKISGVKSAGFVGLLCLALGACGGQESERDRLLRYFNRPIINGTPDTSAAHQAVVYLDLGMSACTGTLIGDGVIVTAAHCLRYAWNVDVGFGNTTGSLDYYSASDWWYHPDFSMSNLTYDIGLVKIDDQPAGVTPIPYLPPSLEITEAEENILELEFVGFGQTETGSAGTKLKVSDTLRWVCTSYGGCDLGSGIDAAQNTICYDQDPGGPCSGDSGGPAFVWRGGQEYVGGITSYGDEDCLYFGCSTKVDAYQDEIVDFLGGENGVPCSSASQCNSGYCVDGVCCATPCSGECQVCNLAPVGTCQTAPNGTPCPDADLCDGAETCQNGSCTASSPTVCNDHNQCTTDSCNPSIGCVFNPVTNGISCADTDVCNGQETCQNGECRADGPLDCDDGNPCSTDTCHPTAGCSSRPAPDGSACPNNNVCDGHEMCIGGTCQPGTPLDCDDLDVCTIDACDPVNGCSHSVAPNGTPCDDGNACTVGDGCVAGFCTQGSAINCDDNNLCTQDFCQPATGCQHDPLPDGSNCGGGLCGEAICSAGECVPADPSVCDDGDPCTRDWCDPSQGCRFDPLPQGHECGECMMCYDSQCVEVLDCKVGGGCGCASQPGKPTILMLLGLSLLVVGRRRR